MRLPNDDTSEEALRAFGADAAALLCDGNIAGLVQHFGYARAFHRDLAYAVWEDLRGCLEQLGATRLEPQAAQCEMRCKYFAVNDTNLRALVEVRIPTDSGGRVLAELIVTGVDAARYITLEDISA